MQQRGGILTLAVLDGGEKNDGLFSRMTLNTSASCFVSDCAGDAASPPGWATADIFHREPDDPAGCKRRTRRRRKRKTGIDKHTTMTDAGAVTKVVRVKHNGTVMMSPHLQACGIIPSRPLPL